MSQDYRDLAGVDLLSDSRGYLNATADALRTDFAGPTEPASPVAYMTWADTTTGYIRERNAANDAWITIRRIGVAFGGSLPLTGGTMEGAVNAGGFALTNLGLGTGLSAARAQEVALKADLAAPLFTGDARVNQDPAGTTSLVRKSWADSTYLPRAGGSMTGAIVLAANATADLQAVPRQQVRDFVTFSTSAGHRHTGTDARKVRGSDLDSGTAEACRFLLSNGTGGGNWTTARRLILVPEFEFFHWDTTHDWTAVNLSTLLIPYVPVTGVYAALLRVFVGNGVVEFRPAASGAATQTWPAAGTADYYLTTAIVPVENYGQLPIHVKYTRTDGYVRAYLQGIYEA
jgi:hypothetical protein